MGVKRERALAPREQSRQVWQQDDQQRRDKRSKVRTSSLLLQSGCARLAGRSARTSSSILHASVVVVGMRRR